MRKPTKTQSQKLLWEILNAAPSRAPIEEVLQTRAIQGFVNPDNTILWGRCLGADRSMYDISIDLTTHGGQGFTRQRKGKPGQPTLRCTCPSRRFPCKHEHALMYLFVNGDCVQQESTALAFVERRRQRQKKFALEHVHCSTIFADAVRGTLLFFDEESSKAAQGEVRDVLEDQLLLPIEDDRDATATQAFMTILTAARIARAHLSSERRWRKEAKMITRAEVELEDGLRHLTWSMLKQDKGRATLRASLQRASDDRVLHATTHELGGGGSAEHVDRAEKTYRVCDLLVDLLELAGPLLAESVEDLVTLHRLGDLFALVMERTGCWWVNRLLYLRVLFEAGRGPHERWRKMDEPALLELLKSLDDKVALTA